MCVEAADKEGRVARQVGSFPDSKELKSAFTSAAPDRDGSVPTATISMGPTFGALGDDEVRLSRLVRLDEVCRGRIGSKKGSGVVKLVARSRPTPASKTPRSRKGGSISAPRL